jgi:hypothetical protein
MRALALVAAVLTLAGSPSPASARGGHGARGAGPRGGVHAAPHGRGAAPGPHAARPAPPRYAPRYAPAYPVVPAGPYWYWNPLYYGAAPLWWGWGWGFGYYPLYPHPQYGYAPDDVHRIRTRLDLAGGGTVHNGGGNFGFALGIEGERLGGHLGFDSFYPGPRSGIRGSVFDSATSYGLFSAHLTAAFLSTDVAKVRVEIGASLLTFPDRGLDAGLTSFGPDLGMSAQLGVVGPLAIEAYVRGTPVPVPVIDGLGALVLRFGPFAVKGGWRELAVKRSDRNVSTLAYAGPQVGVAMAF